MVRGRAKFYLIHAEKFCQSSTVCFFKLARTTLAYELLQVTGIATQHSGKRGQARTALLGQFDQSCPILGHNIHASFLCSPTISAIENR